MKVLIATSGIGSRLAGFTKYTNKSLVRVGNTLCITHIINKYPKDTKFYITLGYFGELVKEYLTLAHPNLDFTFITIDNYDQDGSSLGYSMLQASPYLDSPFYFHCCDCIVDTNITDEPPTNTCYVFKGLNGKEYATVNVADDNISNFNPKGEKSFDYIYIGLAYIKDYKQFWDNLKQVYTENRLDRSVNDISSMELMINDNIPFKFQVVKEWYDIGNINAYNDACANIKCDYDILNKEQESISFVDDGVVKYFYDQEICKKRVQRANALYPNVPNILGYGKNFFKMEHVNGELLSYVYTHGEIYNLLNWANEHLWKSYDISDEAFKKICINFYKDKTLSRIESFKEKYASFDYKNINGIEIGSIDELIQTVNFDQFCNSKNTIFHGDFILDNIIKVHDGYKLIDWRQDFGGSIECGDKYYDLAKLRHNMIFNHKNVEDNLFTIKKISNTCIIDIKCNYFLVNQLKDFERFVLEQKLDLKKIKLLTALIWINMAPLHEYPLCTFLLNFGKYNLYLEQYQ